MNNKGLIIALLLAATMLAGCVSAGGARSESAEASRINTQLAAGYLRRGDVDLAMEKVDRALQQDRNNAEAHVVKGMILARAEEYGDADDYYRRAARLAPRDVVILSNVAAYHCQRGRHREGTKMFVQAAELATNNRPAIALANAGICQKDGGKLDEAEQLLRRALAQEPTYPAALRELADISFRKGDLLDARAFLQRLEGVERLGPGALLLGVKIERGLKDRAAAQRYADILLRDFPESGEARALENEHIADNGA